MANQGVSNERKKELAQIDPFQAALIKSVEWASAHKKMLIISTGALFGLGVVFSIIMFNFKQSEIKASELAAKAYKHYEEQYSRDQDARKGYDTVKDDFQTLFDEYPNTSAGRRALINFGKICFEAGNYDQAYDLYARALSTVADQVGVKDFLLCTMGTICELNDDIEQAKSYYLRVEKGGSTLLKDDARFALALIYEKLNDTAAGRRMYEKIAESRGNSMYKPIAQARIQ
ncbi:tetratricopeptide repeat protein [Desulfobacter latus]|uniref:Tetratricopeptide repeat protein n=1 Tax=Desulfobacter latus TaxID=2292 RepID=A0A850T314_9BACT|nr:tetratricopeptide repeat protein [Desulfobacter latus]NWH05491.1 tetratricopeptide repeat protein [Desulfobacter latus]